MIKIDMTNTTNRTVTFCHCPFCGSGIAVDFHAWHQWDRFLDDLAPIEISAYPDQPVVLFGTDAQSAPCPHLVELSLSLAHEGGGDGESRRTKSNLVEWIHPLFLMENPDLFGELSLLTRTFEPETVEWLPQTPFEVTRRTMRPSEPEGAFVIGWAGYVADVHAFVDELLAHAPAASQG